MAAAAVVTVSMGVMKPVLAKLTTLMGDEYRKLKGLRKMVTFLQRELKDMDALLEKMDSADELDPQAKNWRKDIIEMTYNIEDCIDDFMQRVGEANGKMGILRKASKYMRTFKDRHRLANQFQEITAQVMEASERRKRYMLDQSISITAPVVVDPRISAIYKDSASLVGIDAQKDELVNWAMDKEKQLKVMAIVGFGGLGKTTLANEVYRQVGGKFDCKAFVPVSQKPKMIGLFNSLLSQLGLGTYSHACLLQDPINTIIRHLQDKRYFVVVDDLWDIRAWDTIRCAFPENNQCSRVMVTTRIDDVARSCCNNHGYIHNMKPLSEQDSRKLFFDRIFGCEDDCPSELRKPSSEILKKCDGLPLAIITMASMLACQQKRLGGRWEYIQNSLTTKSATSSNYEDMMYILDLSYKNLPHHLKACFLYLGSYPEDHEISRDELVRRWVAEGFVSNSIGQHVWDVADSYFNELVNRSMIQLVGPGYGHYNKMKGIPSCRVHDMLLELITRRCKEDNFLSLVNDPQAVVEVQDKVIRRLSVSCFQCTEHDKVAIASSVNLERIRSLSIFKESNWIPSLLEFKFVRVLFFDIPYEHRNAIDLSVINQLPQLRYLKAVGYVGSDMLISCQIRGLRLLETLDLFGIHLDDISLEIVDAPRLSHLAGRSAKLPDRIGNARSLLTLHGFILPIDSLESIIGLGNLTVLLELHLCFPKEGVGSPNKATWMAALATSLEKLSNLKRLVLDFPGLGRPVALCADELSSLSPPFGNLQVLDLQQGCTFSRVPRWITSSKLHNLRDLRIGVKQVLEEDVAMIGTRLPSLIHLCLRIPGVQTMERIVIGGSTGFPALKRFRFNCNGMSLLTFEAGAMPQLRELELLFDEDEWDMEAPGGLQHLPGLEQIIAHRVSYPDKAWINPHYRINKAELEVLIMGVFQEAADALPTRPAFTFGTYMITPIEEEDYLEWVPI